MRHYNEGWANGFFYNLVYWEIWNEPDLDKDDATNKRTWGGTKKQFFEFYNVAAAHLKKEFPNLKIGGPALACDEQWAADFLDQLEFAPDFFSWHIYANEPYKVVEMAKRMRKLLDDRGFTKTESILNEWNYIRGWAGQDFIHSMRSINSIKGAAYTCAVMAEGQNAPVDMLMYYDTRPSQYNGLWSFYTGERLKGYYAFLAFSTIYQLGEQLSTEVLGDHVYACAARNEKEAAVVITAFNEDDAAEDVELSLKVLGMQNCKQISCYVLDENSDFECQTDVDINGTIHMKRNSILMLRYEGLN
ncbi:MAG: hypothetical protein MJ118_06435 [Clostridia bacterium]|nr:hypothetical protein [Clostridia bacterium]